MIPRLIDWLRVRDDWKRPRVLIYMIVGLGLITWAIASGLEGDKLAYFTVWACGGGLLLDFLDKRSDRESSAR